MYIKDARSTQCWDFNSFTQSNSVYSVRKNIILLRASHHYKPKINVPSNTSANSHKSTRCKTFFHWASCWSALTDRLPIIVEDLPFVVMN